MSFRIATYNVHKCKGIDWRVSPARISEVVATLRVDILALQEVLLSQAEEISRRIEIPFAFGAARQHAGEPYGNAVFTTLPFTSAEQFDITVGQREPRQCLRASLTLTDGTPVHFFAVHLGTSFAERREQAIQLLSTRILRAGGLEHHRIVAGDFNEWIPGLATKLLSTHLKSCDIGTHLKRCATYPGLLPVLHLDQIYYDRCFHLREMHLPRTRLSLVASDHLPLVTSFEKREPC